MKSASYKPQNRHHITFRDVLMDKLYQLNLGEWDSDELGGLSVCELAALVQALERAQLDGELNLETNTGVDRLQQIVDRYLRPTQTTTVTNSHGVEIDFKAAVNLMDGDIRETLANDGTQRTDAQFFAAYCAAHLAMYGEEFEPDKSNPVW